MGTWLRSVAVVAWTCVGPWACDGGSGLRPDVLAEVVPSGPDGVDVDQFDGSATVPPVVEHIVAGAVDETDVAVVALTAGGRAFCSGTLVGPRTVFTAGHCVAQGRVGLGQVRVFFGTRVGGPGVSVAAIDWGVHPGYVVLPDGVPLHDVAYVTLGADAPVAPLPWQASRLQSLVGTRVKMVGYGVTDARHQTGAGVRRSVTQVIVDQDAAFLFYGDGVSGTCQGDSGGPTLVKQDGVTTLVAVTSYGDATCVLAGANTRVDTNALFLAAHVAPSAATSVEPDPRAEAPAAQVAELEPNNGYGSAAEALEGPCVVSGWLAPVGDVDYFRVALPRDATLVATLEPSVGADVDVRLTSSAGDPLAVSDNGPGAAEALAWTNVTASSRVVYLRVYGIYGAASEGPWEAAYTLRVSW